DQVAKVIDLEEQACPGVTDERRQFLVEAEIDPAAPVCMLRITLLQAGAQAFATDPVEELGGLEARSEDHVRVRRAIRHIQEVAAEEAAALEVVGSHDVALWLAFGGVRQDRGAGRVIAEQLGAVACTEGEAMRYQVVRRTGARIV